MNMLQTEYETEDYILVVLEDGEYGVLNKIYDRVESTSKILPEALQMMTVYQGGLDGYRKMKDEEVEEAGTITLVDSRPN